MSVFILAVGLSLFKKKKKLVQGECKDVEGNTTGSVESRGCTCVHMYVRWVPSRERLGSVGRCATPEPKRGYPFRQL